VQLPAMRGEAGLQGEQQQRAAGCVLTWQRRWRQMTLLVAALGWGSSGRSQRVPGRIALLMSSASGVRSSISVVVVGLASAEPFETDFACGLA
jgi:hypothetical protein